MDKLNFCEFINARVFVKSERGVYGFTYDGMLIEFIDDDFVYGHENVGKYAVPRDNQEEVICDTLVEAQKVAYEWYQKNM